MNTYTYNKAQARANKLHRMQFVSPAGTILNPDDDVPDGSVVVTPRYRKHVTLPTPEGPRAADVRETCAATYVTTPLITHDPTVDIMARAICDRINELTDLDIDNSPRNRARWNAVIDAHDTFVALYSIEPWEMLPC
jgi:hypothetical protein